MIRFLPTSHEPLSLTLMIAFFAAAPARAESFESWAARGPREERENDPKAAYSSYSNALTLWKDGDENAGKAKVPVRTRGPEGKKRR